MLQSAKLRRALPSAIGHSWTRARGRQSRSLSSRTSTSSSPSLRRPESRAHPFLCELCRGSPLFIRLPRYQACILCILSSWERRYRSPRFQRWDGHTARCGGFVHAAPTPRRERLARGGCEGVKLEVVSTSAPRGGAEIVADVTDRLGDDARLDGAQVSVAVHGRSAALSGVVGSLVQRDAVTEDAFVSGVDEVFWDTRVGGGEVTPEVAPNGDVTLTGLVYSWGEARSAGEDAVRAGATRVTNEIRLSGSPALRRSRLRRPRAASRSPSLDGGRAG